MKRDVILAVLVVTVVCFYLILILRDAQNYMARGQMLVYWVTRNKNVLPVTAADIMTATEVQNVERVTVLELLVEELNDNINS
jgi:hypothetical protein